MCFVCLDPQRGDCRDEGSIQVSPGGPAHFLFLFFFFPGNLPVSTRAVTQIIPQNEKG